MKIAKGNLRNWSYDHLQMLIRLSLKNREINTYCIFVSRDQVTCILNRSTILLIRLFAVVMQKK